MSLTVDFITLGDASDRLNVPSATLRFWTDQLEEYNVHYVLRNNRNERIYYDSDLKIFEFLRDLKAEYGRRTTTKDLAYMVIDKANKGEFVLRSKEEAPEVKPTNRTADLLNQEDIQRLMQSERVKQFIGVVVSEATKNIRDELKEEFNRGVDDTNKKILEAYERIEKNQKEREERLKKRIEERDKVLMETLRELQDRKKSIWQKLFGK